MIETKKTSVQGMLLRCMAVASIMMLLFFLSINAFSFRKGYLNRANRLRCTNNLLRICEALTAYREKHGDFPPAFTVDSNLKPLHSWRTLLLPFLDQKELYDKIRLEEPWDSEYNRQFHGVSMSCYHCVSSKHIDSVANYECIIDNDTTKEPILIVDIDSDRTWMEPNTILVESFLNGNSSGNHSFSNEKTLRYMILLDINEKKVYYLNRKVDALYEANTNALPVCLSNCVPVRRPENGGGNTETGGEMNEESDEP